MKEITKLYCAMERTSEIAKKFNITQERVRQIAKKELGEEYKNQKEIRSNFFKKLSKTLFKVKYKTDENFRNKYIKRAKKRYARIKTISRAKRNK